MLQGITMDRPLRLDLLLWRAERVYGDKHVIADGPQGLATRTYADLAHRSRRLGDGLAGLGVDRGDRVASLGWNTHAHLEAYFGVPAAGAVLHTANFRLPTHQVAHTLGHGGARVLLVDAENVAVVEAVAAELPHLQHVVVMNGEPGTGRIGSASVHRYEDVVASGRDRPAVEGDEREAAVLCYTSATTGAPKGILYSHRALVLHALQHSLHGAFGVRESMRVVAVAPMFHANGWGIPFAASLQGATLVLPGPRPDGGSLTRLVHATRATHLNAAVTLGAMIREHATRTGTTDQLRTLEELWLGGQAPPPALQRWFHENTGAAVYQGWGLTETAVITYNRPRAEQLATLGPEELFQLGVRQGTPNPLAEIAVVDEDGTHLPWDGRSTGEYVVRGPSIGVGYFRDPARSAAALTEDGWLRTGDVGVIDPDGSLRLLDRQHDLIKSGGEWIGTVQLENALSTHPKVAETAVVAVPHETWVERPLAWVVPVDPSDPPSEDELRGHLDGQVEKWWVPDRFDVVRELPRTGVGKTDKKTIRRLASERAAGTEPPTDPPTERNPS